MDAQYNLKLIDGNFTPSDASDILITLVQNKINFHQIEKLSNEERFNKDITNSAKRIEELTDVLKTLRSVIDQAEKQHLHLKVKGYIEIELVR